MYFLTFLFPRGWRALALSDSAFSVLLFVWLYFPDIISTRWLIKIFLFFIHTFRVMCVFFYVERVQINFAELLNSRRNAPRLWDSARREHFTRRDSTKSVYRGWWTGHPSSLYIPTNPLQPFSSLTCLQTTTSTTGGTEKSLRPVEIGLLIQN